MRCIYTWRSWGRKVAQPMGGRVTGWGGWSHNRLWNYPKENILHIEHGESLKSRMLHLYGEETTRHICLFEKLCIKKTKLLTSLTFLLRCWDHNTIPRFLQFHHHIHPCAANKIYQRTSFALLQERIHQYRWELDITSWDLPNTHLRTVNQLSEPDWSLIDHLTLNKAMRVGEDGKARQLKKFTWLHTKTTSCHQDHKRNTD